MARQDIRNLLHHCEGGLWFFWQRNFYFTGTFAHEKEDDKTTLNAIRSCSVCGKTAAQMEEEKPELCYT